MSGFKHQAGLLRFVPKDLSLRIGMLRVGDDDLSKAHARRYLASLVFFILNTYFSTCPLPYCIETLALCIGSMRRHYMSRRLLNPSLSKLIMAMSACHCLLMELIGIYIMLVLARIFGIFCIVRFRVLHLLRLASHHLQHGKLADTAA